MKKSLFLLLLFTYQLTTGQLKASSISAGDYIQWNQDRLLFCKMEKDSMHITACNIYHDTLSTNKYTTTFLSADKRYPLLPVNALSKNFDLQKAFKNKMCFLNNSFGKAFYFLKNDSTLCLKTLRKEALWKELRTTTHKIYKLNLGNDRMVFWVDQLGIFYKQKGALRIRLSPLWDIPLETSEYKIANMDYSAMESNYFNFGRYRIFPKNRDSNRRGSDTDTYIIQKGNQVILYNIRIQFFNEASLISYHDGLIKFYNTNLAVDSQFQYRSLVYETSFEYLIGNQLRQLPTSQNYVTTFRPPIELNCGMVNWYKLEIKKGSTQNLAALLHEGMMMNYNQQKNIGISCPANVDSACFTNRQTQLEWSENYGFNAHIVLYRNGKAALYQFELKNSQMICNPVTPFIFDQVFELNNLIVVEQDNKKDLLIDYNRTGLLRFKTISYADSNYLRYTTDSGSGWRSPMVPYFPTCSLIYSRLSWLPHKGALIKNQFIPLYCIRFGE